MSECTYYAIGDVHGEIEKLDQLLHYIREDALMRKVAHRIVFLGDLIDRGPIAVASWSARCACLKPKAPSYSRATTKN